MFICFHSLSPDKLLTNCLPNISELFFYFSQHRDNRVQHKFPKKDYTNQIPEYLANKCHNYHKSIINLYLFFARKLLQHHQPISDLKTEQVHAEIMLLYLHQVEHILQLGGTHSALQQEVSSEVNIYKEKM